MTTATELKTKILTKAAEDGDFRTPAPHRPESRHLSRNRRDDPGGVRRRGA